MQLTKKYQQRVVSEARLFLQRLALHRRNQAAYPSLSAWDDVNENLPLLAPYQSKKTGTGRDLPHFCIKVPTGGGKTIIATQVLGEIYQTILSHKNGTGLVLWVVPSDQIYKDTLRALKNRDHIYRKSLEASIGSHQVDIWEKRDIFQITPAKLRNGLNILMLVLASTNRQTREQLKFFKDSGGNIVSHFPDEDDYDSHQLLKERVSNLDTFSSDASEQLLVKTSIANLVRISEPVVVLDEGQKAASQLARETIEGFNPSVVLELSATPPKSANVLSVATGHELLREEMIKLPINVVSSHERLWTDVLAQAKDKRQALQKIAEKSYKQDGLLIRPIVLVQVERTGINQQGVGKIHSEHVKKYLVEHLGVHESEIAIKSANQDDLEELDSSGRSLLDPDCRIEWIITKGALQEGWDCPFAYILVSLNNTSSKQSMTQLVGRVLRQPHLKKNNYQALNESYVYCLRKTASQVMKEVKAALEKEGYEGDAASVLDSSHKPAQAEVDCARIRPEIRKHYKKFDGKVFLPCFSVREGKRVKRLDYYIDLLSQVHVEDFDFKAIDWDLRGILAQAKDLRYRISLAQSEADSIAEETILEEEDDEVLCWLAANLGLEHFSSKQLHVVCKRIVSQVLRIDPSLKDQLALVKYELLERTKSFIQQQTDECTGAAFKKLFDANKLCFYLASVECRFELPTEIRVNPIRTLRRDDGAPVQQSLFERVDNDLNSYERDVALFLDHHPEVLWWYRNLVGTEQFSIQGYRREKIYPDFVIQKGNSEKKPVPYVVVVESKGKHLSGNEDTNYKRDIANVFEQIGKRVSWQELGKGFENEQFRFQVIEQDEYDNYAWRDSLEKLITGNTRAPKSKSASVSIR